MKKYLVTILIILVVLVGVILFASQKATAPSSQASQKSTTVKTIRFNKSLYSTTDPASLWVVVNKPHGLSPINYAPTDLVTPNVPLRVAGNESMQLRAAPAAALESMFSAAKQAGLQLMVASGYRSYDYQVKLYGDYVKASGQAAADTYSARPGHSEHQTGLAVDVEPIGKNCELDQCFGDTAEGKWVATNSYRYGFIVRYTPADQAITGYEAEPWHLRYVGASLAGEMHTKGITTLEQFFGVSGGPNY
ncbi:MAG: hypothetical protein JWO41_706 [Candidatus Saccharibacteria bacterium]|nr:hypothetical protein [Candidatus Saccharibacteria bacterium]